MRRRFALILAVAVCTSFTPALTTVGFTQAVETRRVVALYWYDKERPTNLTFEGYVQAAFNREPAGSVEYYAEYFESGRFAGEAQARILRDYLRQKYADREIHALLAVSPVPIEFLLKYRQDLFPDIPIVFYSGVGLEEVNYSGEPPMTGVLNADSYERTLGLALRLHPDTTQAFIITGTPARDGILAREARKQLEGFDDRITLTYLTDLPLDRLIATVKAVPERSVILYSRQSQDDPGRVLYPTDFLDLISRSAPVPVYSPWRSHLGYGSVGGDVDDVAAGATKTAEILLTVARGTPPQDIPYADLPKTPTFDARQLARWNISEDRLPPGSVVLFRQPSIWDAYRGYLVATAIALAVQTALIGGLLVNRARRRRAEAALKRSDERYEVATAAGRVGVWDWNPTTDEIYIDPVLKRVLGFEDHEIDNRIDAWSRRLHAEDATRFMAAARAHAEGGTPSFECEHRKVHRDGSVRWFLTRGSAERVSGGRAERIVGTDTDITDLKLAEAGLERTRHELAHVSRVTTLAEFAASIAHEVSQPLTAILMNAQACLRWLRTTDPPNDELREALGEIADDANRAGNVMSRNRALFRHHTVEKQLVGINSVVAEVCVLARARLQHGGVTLETALEPDLPDVLGDRIELQQVLLNLVLNAIESMEIADGSSRVLQIDTRRTGDDHVQVTVRDSGVGLGGVDRERLFTAFYTTKPEGTGIGLSISRVIIDAHAGRFWAEPGDGPGATFCFTLPIAQAGADLPPAGVEPFAAEGGATSPPASRAATS
jgi:PAS domain S-box-containing protein